MAITASKAETLMGRSFRDAFDKETFYALLKHAPEWRRVDQMVRCVRGQGGYMFSVRLAKKGPGLKDDIMVYYNMPEPEFSVANEERFVHIGRSMAERANREIEATYMKIDE